MKLERAQRDTYEVHYLHSNREKVMNRWQLPNVRSRYLKQNILCCGEEHLVCYDWWRDRFSLYAHRHETQEDHEILKALSGAQAGCLVLYRAFRQRALLWCDTERSFGIRHHVDGRAMLAPTARPHYQPNPNLPWATVEYTPPTDIILPPWTTSAQTDAT